ncbi:MAG: 2-amino-4-hydroxy-6-hydroxymethyldihydropteridine diphosphokinase [Dissulfuribacterales bacterium]
MSKHIAYIGLGSNLKPRGLRVLDALQRINALDGTRITGLSNLYETEPVAADTSNYFLNGVARVQTTLSASELLHALQKIEQELGRNRTYIDRTIDLDILLFEEMQTHDKDMTIPHSRMHLRLFVLKPLFELAPDLNVPGFKKTVRSLLHDLQPLVADTQGMALYHGDSMKDIAAFRKAIEAAYT